MIYFVVDRANEFTMRDFVEIHAPSLAQRVRILHFEDLPQQTTLGAGTYIFAGLDHVTPGGAQLVREAIAQLRAAGCRVLNDPDHVLLRYSLLEALHAKGLNRHGAAPARQQAPNVTFPVFVREASEHNGSLTPLLRDRASLQRELGKQLLRGYRLRDLLVVEYCETGDAHGRYHRYSAFIVGDRIIARELMVGDGWMLKSHTNAPTEAELLAERVYVLGNTHEAALRPIFELSRIDYGRIDYAMVDGRIETWEINTNPTIRRGHQTDPVPIPDEINKLRDPVREHFTRALEAALVAVDTVESAAAIAVRYSDACRRAATPVIRQLEPTWMRRLASAMRPVVPHLKRVIDRVSPYLTRALTRNE